jgi:hypothetical protein
MGAEDEYSGIDAPQKELMSRRSLYPVLVATLLVVGLIPLLFNPNLTIAAPESQGNRLVLAFYYAWYDENSWGSGVPDVPSPRYVSRDRATIERHVSQAQGAGIDALVQSWYGPGNPTEDNLVTLLDVANGKGFKVAVDFEVGSPYYGGSRAKMVEGLRHLINGHANHPAYLRWNGKPVIFFWRQQQYSVADWSAIRQEVDPNHTTIWVAEGTNEAFLSEFDAHHLYSVAWSADPASQLVKWGNRVRTAEQRYGDKIWVATAMPGYDDTRLPRTGAFRRDRANGNYYRETFRGANESGADWVVITSFNEFPEGTYIEPSEAYGDFYLQLTAELSAQFKAGTPPPAPSAPAPAPAQSAPVAPPSAGAVEWTIPNGRFFTQTGKGQGGFSVTDDGNARFWTAWQRLGGAETVGYPISQRFVRDGFVTQAFQKLVLQWRPENNTAVPVNVFDELSKSGFDGTLLENRQTPNPLDGSFDSPGAAWGQVIAGRQDLLNANNAIRSRYFGSGDPLTIFGLPTSRVEDMGNHYALRTQRAVFQQWKENVPWASAGQVTIANGGAIAQELGWLPAEAVQPESVR